MISSEVQRTLVKSPPELWAELSDPKSLARHLGELGEIRITRAEPEKLVEWEAEEARGSVAIKPSGWGTKVTLKASREYTPAEPEVAEPEPDPAEAEPPSGGSELEDIESGDTELVAPLAADDDVETAQPATPDAEALPEAAEPLDEVPVQPSGLDAWSQQEAELTVTAAERFGHEHSASLLGSDLQAAADRELETLAPEAQGDTEQPQLVEPEPSEPAPEAEAPAPRMGFFARLFGRGRRKSPGATAPGAQDEPTIETVTEPEAEPEPALSAFENDAETAPAPALDQPEPEPESVPIEEPQLESLPEPEPESVPAITPTAETQSTEPAGPAEQPAEGEDATEAETEPQVDLAAELKAAEEAAEEEVRMILTGVLDRLGAAHHRPFSRA